MADITNNTPSSETDALDIFEKQREQFALTEEETEYIKKLGLDDIDLSEIDLSFDDEPLYILENMSLEECLDLNDTPDYCNSAVADDYTKAEIVSCCLDALYDHIGTNSVDENMINLNEKLLCFAEGADLVNAITCMGLQLAEYNRDKEGDNPLDLPGDTGAILNFYSNLEILVSDRKLLDADFQTTLAHEAHLVENDMYAAEKTMYNFSDILGRVKDADSYLPQDGEYMYEPGLIETSANVVKKHYQEIFYAFDNLHKKLSIFIMKLLEGDIVLDESGKYNRQKSVFFMAKAATFGQGDYELPGDEHRVYEYKEKPDTSAEPKAEPQKLAEKGVQKCADEEDEKDTVKQAITTDYAVNADHEFFFRKEEYKQSDYKRECMAYTCCQYLSKRELNYDKCTDYAEKLMELDKDDQNTDMLSCKENMYAEANSNGIFYGYLNEKLNKVKQTKEKFKKEPDIMDTPLLTRIELLAAVAIFIAIMCIPIGIFESFFLIILRIIYVLIGIFGFLAAGLAVVVGLPVCIVIINAAINVVATFINPALILKIIILAIVGWLIYSLYEKISRNLRQMKNEYRDISVTKKRWLPKVEKFLSFTKEHGLPQEMITYYERLKSAFEEL